MRTFFGPRRVTHRGPASQYHDAGLIVGSATITHCTVAQASRLCEQSMNDEQAGRLFHPLLFYEWHLSDVKRLKKPRTVKGQPQPVWFRPFS